MVVTWVKASPFGLPAETYPTDAPQQGSGYEFDVSREPDNEASCKDGVMAITVLYVLAAGATVIGASVGAVRAALKWRERRVYGPGEPQFDLAGQRVTWARRTGMAEQRGRRSVARFFAGGFRAIHKP